MVAVTTKETELQAVAEDVRKKIEALDIVLRMHEEAVAEERSSPYKGLLQDDAIRLVLEKEGRKLNSSEIAEAMKAGGYIFASANPPNAVVVAANTNRRGYFTTEKEGNRTLIGLKEWWESTDTVEGGEEESAA